MKSTWRVDTITTGRIQTATNLTFVYDEIDDPYYETVIRFDLPLGADYQMKSTFEASKMKPM